MNLKKLKKEFLKRKKDDKMIRIINNKVLSYIRESFPFVSVYGEFLYIQDNNKMEWEI